MKKILILLCLCCAAAGLSAETSLPVEAPAAQEEALSSKIKEIADRFRAVNTISARFTQEKKLAILNEPVLSRGLFYFSKKPSRIRWEYTEPFQNGFLLDADNTYRLEKGVKKKVKGVLARNIASQMLVWLAFDLQSLSNSYHINLLENGVELTPKSDDNKILEKITVWFSKTNSQALEKIQMDEPGGDNTVLIFENTKINEPIAEELFS